MTDHDGIDDGFEDIDALLEGAAINRPDSKVEERLLLRMLDEAAVQREVSLSIDGAQPAPEAAMGRIGATGHPRLRLALAAAVVLIAGVAGTIVLSRGDDPSTSTAGNPESGAPVVDLRDLDAACARLLPTLADITEDRVVTSPLEGPLPALDVFDELLAAITEIRSTFAASGIDDVDVATRLAELEQQIGEQRDRYIDGRVASANTVAATLARRIERLGPELADLGATNCAPLDPDE